MDNAVLELQLAELKAAFPGRSMIPLMHAARFLRMDPRTLMADQPFTLTPLGSLWPVCYLFF